MLPGDTLILDCYYDSTSRDFVTYGGESTREEMCFSFFFYYPAVEYPGSGSAKTYNALATWMYEAKAAGYLTGDLDRAFEILGQTYDERQAFADIGYNTSDLDGALEFYNRLWNPEYEQYDQNHMGCGSLWWDNLQQPTGFQAYDPDIFTCDDTITANDDEIICPIDDSTIMKNMFIASFMGLLGFIFL